MRRWKKPWLAACVCALATPVTACTPEPPAEAETVVLVHGLGRTPASMAILQARLAGAGYRIVNFGYPSRSESIEALTDSLGQAVRDCCPASASTVHFVTHSMGGVLVRSYLAERKEPFEGRVVMLSPPSQGSEIVDAYADSPFLRSLLGPSGVRLGTDSTGIASELGPIDFELGIITGDRSINPIGSWLIPGPDDGKVSVARARLEGAADFLVVHATHTFIMNRADVAEQVAHFLEYGEFLRDAPDDEASTDTWPACDGPDTDPWVIELRDRVLQFDLLAGFAVQSYGAPLTCEGAVTSQHDGMRFGSLRLGFSAGASLLVETMPPEASVATLRDPAGFEDEALARQTLEEYTERIGVEIDWTAPEVAAQNSERVERFRDPDAGLNASASLVYSGGSLVELRFSMAL